MKKNKTQKGITLIALIISIVVLLILAVVTVGSVKDSGIINHAQNAASQTEIAQIKEAFELKKSEKLLESVIDKTTNTGFTLNDLDISDNLKSKYSTKLTISGGVLYYTDEVSDEEKAYFEKQGISSLPQQNPDGSDVEDSTFKIAVKNAVKNTTKTGDYYNLVTVMNKVKQDPNYQNIVGIVLADDYNGAPVATISEDMFEQLDVTKSGKTTILLKNGDEEIEVSSTGNVADYDGNYVLMYDLDAMNEFGLKRVDEDELEVISYKGSNPNIVVPAALYDDTGKITAAISVISESAFVKDTNSQPTPIPVPTYAQIDNETYNAISVYQLFSGLSLPVPDSIDGSSTDNRDKLRAVYELFLSGALGANTTASVINDENLIPSMFATMDGAEVNFVKRKTNIDITTIKLPAIIQDILTNAFKDQTTLTSVTLPIGYGTRISTTAFSGCTNLARIDFVVANPDVDAEEITAISGFSTRWGAPEGTKIYLNGTALN